MACCNPWITIKIILFVLCIVCLILIRIADYDASRLFFLLEKLSYEWPLLNNITWDENGAAFVYITYGGFIIITAGMIIAAACGELQRTNRMETFFLVLGGLMFGAAGALILAALDQVPTHLVDHAASLGVISLITALIFFLDFALASKRRKRYKPPPTVVIAAPQKSIANNSTQTNDPRAYMGGMGPLFVSRTEAPIHRFRNPNHTSPKWLGGEGEFTEEPFSHQGMDTLAPPPPPGFTQDTPSRGFVMNTAKNWPRLSTTKKHTMLVGGLEDELMREEKILREEKLIREQEKMMRDDKMMRDEKMMREDKMMREHEKLMREEKMMREDKMLRDQEKLREEKVTTRTAATRTMSTESKESQATLDPDIHHHYLPPHQVEITTEMTESPRTVINTKVLHRWLNQKRDMNGTNNLV